MNAHLSCQLSAALALAALLVDHPEVQGITWSADPLGVLRGEQYALDGDGRVVDTCATILGGRPVRSVLDLDGDRTGLVQLATVWRGVPVEIRATYPMGAGITVGGVR
ncbi:hypothetical protein ACWCQE_27515 [Streptomyces sp. NPDC002409]